MAPKNNYFYGKKGEGLCNAHPLLVDKVDSLGDDIKKLTQKVEKMDDTIQNLEGYKLVEKGIQIGIERKETQTSKQQTEADKKRDHTLYLLVICISIGGLIISVLSFIRGM